MKKFLIALVVFVVFHLLVNVISKKTGLDEDIKDIVIYAGFFVYMVYLWKTGFLDKKNNNN